MPLKVLIVGASIAGPATAYCFARAGAAVTVIERFPSLRKGGQNVDIRSVGVTVMRKLPGLEDKVRSKLYKIDGFRFVDSNNSPIATMLATGNADQQSLVSEYEIFRGDLSSIFYDLTKDKVKYIFNEQIEAIQQSEDSATVRFRSGSSETYDLVVACDGSSSRTRAIGFECAVRDHIVPMNAWAAYFTIPNDIIKSNMGHSYSAVPGLFLGVGPDPAAHGSKVALISVYGKDKDSTLPFREAQKKDLKTFVCDRLKGQGWKCDEIIEGLQHCDDLYASELVQVKMSQLSKGRFVLVGDAGYAAGPTGTGTSMAMAGAYILAGEVMKHGVVAGLRSYEERMQPIIKDLGTPPPGIPGLLAPQTAWGLYMRNFLFKAVAFGSSLGPYLSWINGIFGSAFAHDKYGIPDYEWPQ